MGGSDEYGVSTNAVHVDTCPRLNVIQVDVAILCNKVNDIILGSNLKLN